MSVMGVSAAAVALGMSPSAVYKAIARGTLSATVTVGGLRGNEYAIADAEVERYRQAHRRPGHRRIR